MPRWNDTTMIGVKGIHRSQKVHCMFQIFRIICYNEYEHKNSNNSHLFESLNHNGITIFQTLIIFQNFVPHYVIDQQHIQEIFLT